MSNGMPMATQEAGAAAPVQVGAPSPTAWRRSGQVAPWPVSGAGVVLGLALFAAVWLAHLASVSLSPPTDSIEQLTWVRLLDWGYYKHPPLPTWLVWLPVRLLGLTPLATALLGAACTLGAAGLLWGLLVRLRGRTHASVALLALLGISFYNGRLDYYNHNVVLLLLSTAAACCTWLAFRSGRWGWWVALGGVLGLAFLAKYQAALTVAALAAFALQQRAWRSRRQCLGLLLAAAVALLVVAPHLAWLQAHDFPPLHYARATSLDAQLGLGRRSAHTLRWLLDQLFNRGLPAVLLLAWTAWGLRPRGPQSTAAGAPPRPGSADAAARALLLAWGVVPLAAMVLLGVATGAKLQLHWGTPFLMFTVPAAMELAPRVAWSRAAWRQVLPAFLVLQAVLLGLSQLASPRGWSPLQARHWRGFPSQALASQVAGPARQQLGGPVRVVSGPAAIAGALALQLPERPRVLIDGRPETSPWVPADAVARCGVLELVARAGTVGAADAPAAPAPAVLPPGLQRLPPPLHSLGWRVRPPQPGQAACPLSQD